MAASATKRAESRTRYYTRAEAERLGWNVQHPSQGGSFLEEQEIVDYFPVLRDALGSERPDFAAMLDGKVAVVVECKNDWREIDKAVDEACGYADAINKAKGFGVRLAVGLAGTPDKRVLARCCFRRPDGNWVDLRSHGYALTQLPAPAEAQTALGLNNGTTDVQLPDEREFFSAAVNISRMLRLAKIEEAHRPRVIGAIILALYQGDFPLEPDAVVEHINTHVAAAVKKFDDVPLERRGTLSDTLHLSTEADPLRAKVADIVHQLERLNVRSIMRSGVDFLGQFYETFLRYGQDTKKLGIVFTPRHITRFCAELVDAKLGDTVYDPACGTGGFLVAAFDRMMRQANTPAAKKKVKESLWGCDTNATVWALAVLNMFFRGDGKSHIIWGSCFKQETGTGGRFDRALLNPPFSQEGEPETEFIDHALKSLTAGGRLAVVVKTNVMVDPKLKAWRRAMVASHHVEAVISLPLELFYPTSAPTVILVVRAHAPDLNRGTFLAKIKNDGFEISKKRRVPIKGEQLSQVLGLFRQYEQAGTVATVPSLAMAISRDRIANGEEICAEQWLPTAAFDAADVERRRLEALRNISLAVANYPDVVDEAIENYESLLAQGPAKGKPVKRTTLYEWFAIKNGESIGSKNYPPGPLPFVSSGDSYNGITTFIAAPDEEIYSEPRISVSGFGQAYIQPWRFCARGNGGSAVRILRPRFAMSAAELFWFVGQINLQRWRFHYGRMANPTRLGRLEVDPPAGDLPRAPPMAEKLRAFRRDLENLTNGRGDEIPPSRRFAELAAAWRAGRGNHSSVARLASHPAYQQIIGMGPRALPFVLAELEKSPDHWFWAMHAITGADPVPLAHRGRIKAMANDWIQWAKEQGHKW